MFSQNGMNIFINDYWDNIHKAAGKIKSADRVVIGIGSGMTAAGGLCYTDPALAEKWYPEYYAIGKRSIIEIMSLFWPTTINKKSAAIFWGFWAKHIYHIRYEACALQPYLDLADIIGGKDYFICSTNVDGQLEKAGFDKNKIFAPQGDYAFFQCEKPCSQNVYSNNTMIEIMLEHMVSPFEIREEDIPRCPLCGRFLIPNLRCDFNFAEKPHIQNMRQYETFLSTRYDTEMVLLELGVGFNTPGIIRFPFETIASKYPHVSFIRVNNEKSAVPGGIANKSIGIQEDVGKVLNDLNAHLYNSLP